VTSRHAQLRMFAIELHEQPWNSVEFLSWLLALDDGDDAVERVLDEETRRATILAENHYQRVTQRVAVLNPHMIASVGFIQGATFAAAALDRPTWREQHEGRA
jgi:hypothetical protein